MPYATPKKLRKNFSERSNYKKEIIHSIVIYADFNCISVRTNNPLKPFDHVPCTFGYVVVDWNRKIIGKQFQHGENIVERFLLALKSSISLARDIIRR